MTWVLGGALLAALAVLGGVVWMSRKALSMAEDSGKQARAAQEMTALRRAERDSERAARTRLQAANETLVAELERLEAELGNYKAAVEAEIEVLRGRIRDQVVALRTDPNPSDDDLDRALLMLRKQLQRRRPGRDRDGDSGGLQAGAVVPREGSAGGGAGPGGPANDADAHAARASD